MRQPLVRPLLFCTVLVTGGCGGGHGGSVNGRATVGAPTLATLLVELTPGFPNARHASLAETADIDGDGDLDVFFGTQLYRNDGGTFDEVLDSGLPNQGNSAAFGDADGDGDVDLFFASKLWFNDGKGHFADVTATNFLPGTDGPVMLGDLDGDGDLDAVIGTTNSRVFVNNGPGVFTEVTATWMLSGLLGVHRLMADFDGDGDPDMLGSVLQRNTGTSFVIDPAPIPWMGTSAAVGDLDGDGDLDVVGTNSMMVAGSPWNLLLINDGAGHFADHSTQLPQDANFHELGDVAIGDVDGDGDLDVVIAPQGNLLLNDGRAQFRVAPEDSLPSLVCRGNIALADLDADGDLDLVLGSSTNFACVGPAPNSVLYNDGLGRFSAPNSPGAPAHPLAADIDNDGDVDGVGSSGVSLNDGTGSFTTSTTGRFTPPADGLDFVAAADLDGDGDADAVFRTTNVPGRLQNRVYRNDGTGFFTAVPHPTIGETFCSALGDVDGDGDLDLVHGRGSASFDGRQTVLLENDGHAGFTDVTAAKMPVDAEHTQDVGFCDVDGDGDLDLVLAGAGWTGRLRIYVNDGNGTFRDESAVRLPSTQCFATAVTLVDLENDGDVDILVSSPRPILVFRPRACWYRNEEGTFVDASATLAFNGMVDRFEAIDDFDNDGDLDVAIQWDNLTSFFLQDAPAVFREDAASRTYLSGSPPTIPAVQPADLDGDGDLEWNGRRNVARHLFAPGPARIGGPWRLDVFARPGWLSTPHLVQVHVGLTLATPYASLPPLGTFHLDPGSAITLPSIPLPAPSGKATLKVSLPQDPTLIGQPLHAQALIVDPDTGIGGFTNRVTTIVGR